MPTKNNILNYSTEVEAGKTVADITALLVRKQANSVTTDYKEGRVVALTFVIRIGENMVPFRMEPNIAGVAQRLPNKRDVARVERVAWRILLRWTEAQIAMVESSQAEMGQVFLPYAVREDGATLWTAFLENNQKRIGAGS